MGSALFIAIKEKPSDLETFMDGKSLARAWKSLDAAATVLGIPSITKLCNNAWKNPDKGIPVFEQYLAYVREHTDQFERPDYVIDDLNDVIRLIKEAQRLGTKWRLLLDY